MRETIRDATLAILLEGGEPAVTLAAVAARAMTSKANVVHHFGTRERLLDAVHARLIAEAEEGLAALSTEFADPRERLEAFVAALFAEPADLEPEAAARLFAFHLARRNADLALASEFLDQLLSEGARTGAWRPPRRPRFVADALFAAAAGARALWAGGADVDTERLGTWALETIVRPEIYREAKPK